MLNSVSVVMPPLRIRKPIHLVLTFLSCLCTRGNWRWSHIIDICLKRCSFNHLGGSVVTLASHFWGLWFKTRILCRQAGSCLHNVWPFLVQTLDQLVCIGFPLSLKLPIVIWLPLYIESDIKHKINKIK